MLLSPDQITHVTDLLAALCIDTGIQNMINKSILGLFIPLPDAVLVQNLAPQILFIISRKNTPFISRFIS